LQIDLRRPSHYSIKQYNQSHRGKQALSTSTSYDEFTQGDTSIDAYAILAETSTFTGYTVTDHKDESVFVIPVSYTDKLILTLNGSLLNLDLLYGFVTAAQLSQYGIYASNEIWDVATSQSSQSISGSVSASSSGGFVDVVGSPNATSGTGFLVVEVSDLQLGPANVQNDFTVKVQGPPAPLPDLVVKSDELTASQAPVGGNIEIAYTLQNLGDATAIASQLGVYICDSSVFSPANVKYSFDAPVGALTANEVTTGTLSFALPKSLPADTYYVFLKANDTGSVIESNAGNDLSAWSELTINPPALFHASPPDIVNFNSLTDDQIFAIENGANQYDGLGGDDIVTLPDEAHENYTLPGAGYQFVWYESLSSQFETQSLSGQHATVRGDDGNYYITLGAGDDTVNINNTSGRISDNTIVCGSGHDFVSIHDANGDNGVTGASGALTLNIDGYGNNKLRLEGAEPGPIYGTIATTQNPFVANNGSFTFQFLLNGVDTFNGTLSGDGEVNVFGGQLAIAHNQGALTGDFAIQQGTLELMTPGGAGSGHIVFENNIGGDILQIDGTAMPANVIDGFTNQEHQKIDLRGVAFTGNGSVSISSAGVLSVTPDVANAATAYRLNLDPTFDYSGLTPVLYEDGEGGTIIDFAQTVAANQNIQTTFSLACIVYGRVHLSVAPLDAIAIIAAGGISATTLIEAGGKLIVDRDGRAVTGTVQSGGMESDYGRDIASTVNGSISVMQGGFASALTVTQGGAATVTFGGKVADSSVGSLGTLQDSGRVILMTIDAKGQLTVTSGGFSSGAAVQSGGALDVQFGARSVDATSIAGGAVTVEGRAIGHVVAGSQAIGSGGFASNTDIQSGGVETILLGARTSGDNIAGSVQDFGRVLSADVTGKLIVGSGGFVATSTVKAAGSILIQSDGIGRDLVIAGGIVEAQAGGSLVDALTFTGDGTLRLDSTASRVDSVSGFGDGDIIDFRAISFNSHSASVAYAANSLSITDGVQSETLSLLGAFNTASFATLSDGAGGTFVELAAPIVVGPPILPVRTINPA
jgi:autotransporter passenger strand-loop-strand repeat protein